MALTNLKGKGFSDPNKEFDPLYTKPQVNRIRKTRLEMSFRSFERSNMLEWHGKL